MNDIFLAFGDSFTWGHGLQYYDWIENSKLDKEQIKDFLLREQRAFHHSWPNWQFKCSVGDLESMKKRRYTNLLSKELKMDYIARIYNGGQNIKNILDVKTILNDKVVGADWGDSESIRNNGGTWWDGTIDEINYSLKNDKLLNRRVKFVILQLSDVGRDDPDNEDYTNSDWHKNMLQSLYQEVEELYTLCKKEDIKLFVWAWPADVAEVFLGKSYFIEIEYDNKKYISYDNLKDDYPQFCLGAHWGRKKQRMVDGHLGEYGVCDEHPSELFHNLIGEIILNRINGEV